MNLKIQNTNKGMKFLIKMNIQEKPYENGSLMYCFESQLYDNIENILKGDGIKIGGNHGRTFHYLNCTVVISNPPTSLIIYNKAKKNIRNAARRSGVLDGNELADKL